MYEAMVGIRSITGSSVPVYVWQPASAAGIMFRFGPKAYGGNGDLSEKIKSITANDEQILNEEAEKARPCAFTIVCKLMLPQIYNRSKRELINIPGIPLMYDYEFSPQQASATLLAGAQ